MDIDPLHIKKWRKIVQKNSRRISLAGFVLISMTSFAFYFQLEPIFFAHAYEEVKVKTESKKEEEVTITELIKSKNEVPEFLKQENEKSDEEIKQTILEETLVGIVSGHPIEEMVPYIAKQDERVAAFLVGIAKKESNWGKRSPSKNDDDCYNYWGYKGSAGNGTSMGYACFESPEEAVKIVGGRLEKLVKQGRTNPQKMIVWKCGSSCAGHSDYSVEKWISDVSLYFHKIVS